MSKLIDREARRKIVEELDRTFFVEAGAGSGKTKSLVDRMIALLSAGRCTIATLAAVTFTRKAAAELRGRFQVELERKVAGDTEPGPKKRLADALQNLEQCYIGTIHSFCAKLLRERPIEIGLDPDFAETEEIEDQVFREKCWNDYMVKVRLEQEDLVRELEDIDLAPEDLKDAFEAVSLYPEVKLVGGSGEQPSFDKFRAALEDFLRLAKGLMPNKPEKGYDGLQRLVVRCIGRQSNLGFSDHGLLMETLEILDKKFEITWNRWPERETAETLKQALNAFRENVVAPALKRWREYRQDKIARFLAPAVGFYTERRKEENRLNYEDLLMHARRLLLENPEVRSYFSRKFTHLLVDEFQDTDPIQAEVLLYLKGQDTKQKDWRKVRVAPGALFLVGDPKQSIFRFRRADIDTYNLVKETIIAGGGEVLSLTTNFRSLGALAEWNNPIFKAVFPAEATRHQAAFALLETVRREEKGTASGVRKIVLPAVKWNKGEEIAEVDAAVIAEWIRWACDGNMKLARSEEERLKIGDTNHNLAHPSDFMILFRYKKNMDAYARALERRGVPFEITGSDAFAGAEEIQEIINLALALNDPDNPIYTVAVLRGIFFGASDNDLMDFRREGGKFNFMAAGREIVQSRKLGVTLVAIALAKMREWRGWTIRMPPSAALGKIFEESGILNYLASKEMGSSRVGNLLKLLEMLRNEERKGMTSFSGAVKFMEELAEVREIEEMSLTPARENAVRLMNLHKAKGLEAPVVFLANPVGMKDHPVDKHVIRTEGVMPSGSFVFSKRGIYQAKILSQPVGWEKAAEEERKYEEAEEQRLMYVAATRARNMLVVSTYEGDLGDRRSWRTLDEALGEVPELEGTGEWIKAVEEESFRFPAVLREKVDVAKAELERARKEMAANLERGAVPTYAVESVTSVARREIRPGEKPAPSGRRPKDKGKSEAEAGRFTLRKRMPGFGLTWGRLVHQVLEAIGSGRMKLAAADQSKEDMARLELFIENMLAADADEGDFSDKKRLIAHIESILCSPFWARVMKAEKRYFEIPFSIKTDKVGLEAAGSVKAGLGAGAAARAPKTEHQIPKGAKVTGTPRNGADIPVILSGTIDLVFWEPAQDAEPGGWVIADYKTDKIPITESALKSEGWELNIEKIHAISPEFAAAIDFYAPQIRVYSKFWQQITGESVLESGLYFTSIGRWVRIR
jgi:ATP-dependent helicase/nuclease subunit A